MADETTEAFAAMVAASLVPLTQLMKLMIRKGLLTVEEIEGALRPFADETPELMLRALWTDMLDRLGPDDD